MPIQFPAGFNITSKDSIDKRLALTKQEMKSAEIDLSMPDEYFCICKDDGKLYIFNKNNTVDSTTGKFRLVSYDDLRDTPDTVSGVNDGTNWTSITIGDVTKNIPQGGSGGTVTWDDIQDKPNFATVATTGDYDDLTDKPSIPDVEGNPTVPSGTSITPLNGLKIDDNYYSISGSGGTSDHRYLDNLDAANQHPISAIIGLQDALDAKQVTLISSGQGQNIKTVNGNELLGSGNINIASPFSSSWRTNSIVNLIADVEADQNAIVGKTYLGEVTVDVRDGLFDGNAEFMINIMDVQSGDKVLWCIASSATVVPYHWEATFVGGQISPNGWTGYQSEINSNNKISSDLVDDDSATNQFVTATEKTEIADNTSARHTHSNKDILDNITAAYTTAEATKLDGIENGAQVNAPHTVIDENYHHISVSSSDGVSDGTYTYKYELPSDVVQDSNYAHITVNSNSVSDGTTTISNIVSDTSYVHTDNNFTNSYKSQVEANTLKVSNVQSDWNASSGTAQILNKPSLGTAAAKDYTTDETLAASGETGKLPTAATIKTYVDSSISALPEPMIFKGTASITKSGNNYTVAVTNPALSADIVEGYTYKISSAPADDPNFKVGDTLIAEQSNPGTNPLSHWALIPSGDDVEDTWRDIKVNGSPKLGNGISTGFVNFEEGTNVTITATDSLSGDGKDITISSKISTLVCTEAGDTPYNVTWYKYTMAAGGYLPISGELPASVITQNNIYLVPNTTFRLLESQPSDWTTKWFNYYYLEDLAYINISSSQTWEPNTYYEKLNQDNYSEYLTEYYYNEGAGDVYTWRKVQDNIIIDDFISPVSENPVQNKVIKSALDNLENTAVVTKTFSPSLTIAEVYSLVGDKYFVCPVPNGAPAYATVAIMRTGISPSYYYNVEAESINTDARWYGSVLSGTVIWEDFFTTAYLKSYIDKNTYAHNGSILYGEVTQSGGVNNYTPTELTIGNVGDVLTVESVNSKNVPVWTADYSWRKGIQVDSIDYEKYGPSTVVGAGDENYGIQIGDYGLTVDREYYDGEIFNETTFRVDKDNFKYNNKDVLLPERVSIVKNLVLNMNNVQQFEANKASWSTAVLENGYWTRTFYYDPDGHSTQTVQTIASKEKAAELVEYLTGRNVLDEYNQDKPTPCFVYCQGTSSTDKDTWWKLQWVTNVSPQRLKAYRVDNFPLQSKLTAENGSGVTITSTWDGTNHLPKNNISVLKDINNYTANTSIEYLVGLNTGGIIDGNFDNPKLMYGKGLPILDCSTAGSALPTSRNENGLIIVLCSVEPQDKYPGYLYLVMGAY